MAHINANTRLTLLTIFIALFVATGIGTATARLISRPIVRLNDSIKATVHGDWGEHVRENVPVVEIRELTASFNAMVARLHKAMMERDKLIGELKAARSEVKQLSGLLPICGHCKKIRDDQGSWHQLEAYIRDHADVDFSHSICPECLQKYYPELNTKA